MHRQEGRERWKAKAGMRCTHKENIYNSEIIIITGAETISLLASAPDKKLHHPKMSMIWVYGDRLDRNRYRDRDVTYPFV